MVHLGFGIDSRNSSFSITEKYRGKFKACRSELLTRGTANLLDLQRWIGKCNHLRLVFPANSLFTFQARQLLPGLGEDRVPVPPAVLEEIAFWTFVDSFTEPIPFLLQQHVSLRLHTDASGYAWGASVDLPDGPLVIRDYWSSSLFDRDICAKEGLAVLFGLQSIEDRLFRRRVDVFVDNEGLVQAWNGLRAKSAELVGVLQSLFLLSLDLRMALRLHWVPTDRNPADAPSRALDRMDCMLSPALRSRLWGCYGPLVFDLMALPSNFLRDPSDRPLPFFSRSPSPGAAGVNVFAQSPPVGRLYAFPPFCVITPLIRLFMEWGGVEVVIVLPVFARASSWASLLRPFVLDAVELFPPSSVDVLLFPSSRGFSANLLPVDFGLTAFRCRFPARPSPVVAPSLPPFRVLVLGDSVLRPLQSLSWPAPLRIIVRSFSGASLSRIVSEAEGLASSGCQALLVHAGINDASRGGADFEADFSRSCDSLRVLASSAFASRKVFVSTACPTRRSELNDRVCIVNRVLREFALTCGWGVVSNDNIRISDLSDNVHLGASGTARLYRNVLIALKSLASV